VVRIFLPGFLILYDFLLIGVVAVESVAGGIDELDGVLEL